MQVSAIEEALSQPPDAAATLLLSAPEGQWFERKSARIQPKDLARALVAFANAEGGVVVVGLHDGSVEGLSAKQVNDVRQAAIDFTNPPVRCATEELDTASGVVLILNIAPGESVHETNTGDCYIRIGDESRKLSFAQRRELEFDRGSLPFDGTPSPFNEYSPKLAEEYRALLGASTVDRALRARNLVLHSGAITVAGHLLLSEHPQQAFPNAHVRVLKYDDVDRGTGSRQTLAAGQDHRLEGPLNQQLEEASDAIDRLIPKRQALGPAGRFEPIPLIPREAWLEGLVNAVTHRSYSMMGDHIRVEIFPNRIEILSPGRFPGLADPANPLRIDRHARNPRIARALAEFGLTQELGEGIRRIFQEMRGRGLTDPLYEQGANHVRLTLSAADALPAEVAESLPATSRQALDTLRRASQPLSTGELAELLGVTRATAGRHLQFLRDRGLVVWQGQSPRDPRASWSLR